MDRGAKLTKSPGRVKRFLFGWTPEYKLHTECERRGLPFEELDFWPPFYLKSWGRGNLPDDLDVMRKDTYVLPDLYNAKINDVLPIFADTEYEYKYVVLGTSRAAGDDHIVSPLQFHIRYLGRATLNQNGRAHHG